MIEDMRSLILNQSLPVYSILHFTFEIIDSCAVGRITRGYCKILSYVGVRSGHTFTRFVGLIIHGVLENVKICMWVVQNPLKFRNEIRIVCSRLQQVGFFFATFRIALSNPLPKSSCCLSRRCIFLSGSPDKRTISSFKSSKIYSSIPIATSIGIARGICFSSLNLRTVSCYNFSRL